MADQNPLKLNQFTVTSFAGIDKDSPVIICFPEGFGGYVALQGDQATRKTSTLEAFKACCGLPLPENATNKKDNTRKVYFEFEKGEKKYRVGISKSRFEVELLIDQQKDRWSTISSPKAMLGDLLGPVGISPMFLKEKSGKDQILWLKNFFRMDADAIKMEQQIETNLKEAYKERRKAKKDLLQLENSLKTNIYYNNREEWIKKIADSDSEPSIEDKIKDVQSRFNQYGLAQQKVEQRKNEKDRFAATISAQIKEIEELERKLIAAKEGLEVMMIAEKENDEKIAEGEKWLEEKKSVIEENQNLSKTIEAKNEMAAHKVAFKTMEAAEKESNRLHQEFIRNENLLDGYRKTKKQLIQAITPEIEGLEVCIPDDAGDISEDENEAEDKKPETREGIFYKGMSPVELSESELWGLYSQLLEKLDIKIIMIENISSLGSGAINLFNQFIEKGGYVLASEMVRKEKNLKVIVQNKIIEDIESEEE